MQRDMIAMSGQRLQPFPVPMRWITDALQYLIGGIMLTQARLKEVLHYDPETGIFTWIAKSFAKSSVHIGDIAGGKNNKGYWRIMVDRQAFSAHHLAFLYMSGILPDAEVDHINGVKDDNRFSKLRLASNSINTQNQRKPHKNNNTGFLGVSKRGDRFLAQIRCNGKRIHIGSFNTPELAYAAYVEVKRKLHPGCTI